MNKKMGISKKNIVVMALFFAVTGCDNKNRILCARNNPNICVGQIYREPKIRIACPDFDHPVSFEQVPDQISLAQPSSISMKLGCVGIDGEIVSVSIRQGKNIVSIDARIESDNVSLIAYIDPLFLQQESISEGKATIIVTRVKDSSITDGTMSSEKEITLTK